MINRIVRTLLVVTIGLASLLPTIAQAANDRELYLYYTHTKETIRIVYKRDGKFIQSALNQLNVFLRDWRRNEPAKMDPALFDLLWEVYRQSGASQPVHIVSAYRAPATNAMLASNSAGVAENSQHMQGKAIDFFIPGVPLSRIRELGMLMQVGGVGYYPNSGSPFVHLDTASVRAWPRMTTAQLRQLFPDGRTLHLPSSGGVLSQEGYQIAQAEWARCHRVPCNAGSNMNGSNIQVADGNRPRTLWDVITGGGGNNSQPAQPAPTTRVASAPAAVAAPAAAPTPAATTVQQASAAVPPAPPVRPADLIAGTMVADAPTEPQNMPFQVIDAQEMIEQVALADAPMPPAMSRTLAEMRAETPSAYAPSGGRLELAAIDNAPTPVARPDFPPVIAASLAPGATATAAGEEMSPSVEPEALQQAMEEVSVGAKSELDAFASLFEGAVLPSKSQPDAALGNAVASLAVAQGQLFAPEIEAVAETLLAPATLSSAHFAFAGGAEEPAADAETVIASSFTRTASLGHSTSEFGPGQTLWVRYGNSSN